MNESTVCNSVVALALEALLHDAYPTEKEYMSRHCFQQI